MVDVGFHYPGKADLFTGVNFSINQVGGQQTLI
jgi:hypothetical protein